MTRKKLLILSMNDRMNELDCVNKLNNISPNTFRFLNHFNTFLSFQGPEKKNSSYKPVFRNFAKFTGKHLPVPGSLYSSKSFFL